MKYNSPNPSQLPIYKELEFLHESPNETVPKIVAKYNPQLKGKPEEVYAKILGNTTVIHTRNFSTAFEEKKLHKQSLKKHYKLSKTELKRRGLLDISKDEITYNDSLLLHQLWLGYIETLFQNCATIKEKSDVLATSDVHGAMIKVVQSRNPSCVYLEGIILQETQKTFRIIGSDNKHRILSKQDCIFHLILDKYTFVIYGQHFCYRTAQRSKQKFKTKTFISIV